MNNDTKRQMRREKQILDAARPLFTRFGFDKTSVEDIAREAGISKGAIYLSFSSKQAVFDRLITMETEQLVQDLFDRLDHDPEGYTIFNVYRYSLTSLMQNPLLSALYTRNRAILGNYMLRMAEHAPPALTFSFGEDFVRQFQKAGMIDPHIDATALAYILVAMRYGLMRIDEIMPPPSDVGAIGHVMALMLGRAFGTEAGNQQAAKEALKALMTQGLSVLRKMNADPHKAGATDAGDT